MNVLAATGSSSQTSGHRKRTGRRDDQIHASASETLDLTLHLAGLLSSIPVIPSPAPVQPIMDKTGRCAASAESCQSVNSFPVLEVTRFEKASDIKQDPPQLSKLV